MTIPAPAANGSVKAAMEAVFPEAHLSLQQADEEVWRIVKDEERRQWCVEVHWSDGEQDWAAAELLQRGCQAGEVVG